MTGRCGTCRHWRTPWHQSMNTWAATEEGQDPARWGYCALISYNSGDEQATAAFTGDASDYASWLNTRDDFGCVLHEDTPH
jgi:hypothetical protein